MKVFLSRPDELGPVEIATWHSMQRTAPSLASPFLSPEFAIAVGRFRPGCRVAILTDGQSITGFFPFEKRRFGAGTSICSWPQTACGLVHTPGAEWDPRELLRKCQLSTWQFDCLVPGQRPFLPYKVAATPSGSIDLSKGFASYHANLRAKSPSFCRELARKTRKLNRDAGGLRFVADSRDTGLLRTLMTWKSEQYRRWGIIDPFERPWVVGLFDALLATRTDNVSGLLCASYAGDQPVAVQFGLRSGDFVAGWFTAFDTRWGKYSPGVIHIMQMAEELATAGINTIDMGKGTASGKGTLKSREVLLSEGIVTEGSVLATALRARNATRRWAHRTLTQHPLLFRGTRFARNALR